MTQLQPARTSEAGLTGLFDLSFTRFVTVGMIKLIYVLAIVGLALQWLITVITGFTLSSQLPSGGAVMIALLALIAATVVAALELLVLRMGLELVVVIFRIGRDAERLAHGPAPTGGFPVGPAV